MTGPQREWLRLKVSAMLRQRHHPGIDAEWTSVEECRLQERCEQIERDLTSWQRRELSEALHAHFHRMQRWYDGPATLGAS